MARFPRLAISFIVGFALAVPAVAAAQAVGRPGSSGSSSGSAGSGSGGSSSSGSSGGSVSSGPSSSPAPSRIGPSSSSSSSSRTGSAAPRSAPPPGGVIGTGSSRSGSDAPRGGGTTGGGSVPDLQTARTRGDRGLRGEAVPRPATDVRYISFPFFGPWGRWYPWFGSGFGWYPGFVTYNPYRYGGTRWTWGRYGMWYDPFAYMYDPLYSGYGYYSGSRETKTKSTIGSIRLRVSPSFAKVYVDGVLHGLVSDFDGLTNHLRLEAGHHTLELRADGYETLRREITVEVGRTLTERATLKKL